ncbi:isochorismatase family protein [Deinococcus maricopensis]|uniref:isochorismatase n=1 Tax=Deinococcus maricopensis (strain DSM 21211 / LMG 22137 / NRRL B-23946 / LB-34) TaxID=709986 RepID=E8U3H6_DEIML|nr:isochorismatase family protein [Deinococcus maricopensis]ADV65847.1 Isochorismatase [Deinococcus maricopensis DSM 21211]
MIPRIATYPMPTESDLPRSRVPWTPDAARTVLLVHDLQQYFLDFYDAAHAPIPELFAHVNALLERCRALGIPVVYTAQPGDQAPADRALLTDFWGPGLRDDPAQVRVHPAVAPQGGDTVLTKWRYSAFVRTPLREQLRAWGRDQLLICGVYANIGCLLTAADAFMHDTQAFLIGDAVADFTRAQHDQALTYAAGRCASVLSTRQVLDALPAPAAALSPARVRADLAAHVGLSADDLRDDDDLLLLGLDSIRLMLLVEAWTGAGATITYADVVADPTVGGVLRRLSAGVGA